ncbi:MAG: lytic transglycosylase domain-containing protein [Gemmatimonadota bacterium]|nr:lytic transglycosylase domain-containing protein [Gemmatimonadales bacterium]MDQ3136627.1 lytic transglycosylase domain-containing protein [Gemmatimonadota bacterium]
MKRPTDKYNDPGPRTLRTLLIRGGLLLSLATVIGTLAGWTERVRATDSVAIPGDAGFVARRIGSLGDQLAATRGEMDLLRLQLDRANAIMANSAKYQIPSDLAASIYDIALSEGIDPALGFQLVKIESNFKATARSPMDAIGYTQLQVATARFYEPGVTEKRLMTDRELNLRVGFRFLNDLMTKFDRDAHLALLAYNRGPARVAGILARGGDPANGYSEAVLDGYQAPNSAAPGWH